METYIFYCMILVYKLSPFFGEIEKKIHWKGKTDEAKSVHEAHWLMMQIITLKRRLEERFESILFEISWFFHKLFIILFHPLENFYLWESGKVYGASSSFSKIVDSAPFFELFDYERTFNWVW